MTTVALDRIQSAIAELRQECSEGIDPSRRGPVLLHRFFEECNLMQVALPKLTRGTVGEHLQRSGVRFEDLGDANEALAGFLFVSGRIGWAYVSAGDILPRRRFTAAHELGHFCLHRETMGGHRADTPEMLLEADDEVADLMEREANRFAAELLLPEEVCRARSDELRRKYGSCPAAVLTARLAQELLVSREATRYRLQGLGLYHD